MRFTSPEGERRYAAVVRAAAETVVGLDFDGTLAPIVDDPAAARIHPRAGEMLVGLAAQVRAVAVVTGRPARQVLDLGGLEEVGRAVAAQDKELLVLGQYGNERWTSTERRVVSPRPPAGLSGLLRELPPLLRRLGAEQAHVEEKGLAVAVHTRRLPDPEGAYDLLLGPLTDLATQHGLSVEPGKNVIEVRSPGMHKGLAVDRLVADLAAGGFVFAGDDLGDVEAFEAVRAQGARGLATLLVCSASQEQNALTGLADVVVDGPAGVVDLLVDLTRDAAASRA